MTNSVGFTREELGHISSLVGHPGYELLLKQLKSLDKAFTDELAGCRDAADLLYKARFWQAFHRLVEILATEPQHCYSMALQAAEIEAKQMAFEELDPRAMHRY